MPSIGDMQYGFETAGIETYIEEVRANSLEKAQNDADDIKHLRRADYLRITQPGDQNGTFSAVGKHVTHHV